MTTYAEFKPTSLDPAGLGSAHMGPNRDEDHGSWLVARVARNRESSPAESAAFWGFVNRLERTAGPEGPDWEIHRHRHWGFGWFEIVLIRPGTKAAFRLETGGGSQPRGRRESSPRNDHDGI